VQVRIRPFDTQADVVWAAPMLFPGGPPYRVASCGILHEPLTLPGFVAEVDGTPIGLASYRIEGDECELLTLDSRKWDSGAGTALLQAVADAARSAGCRRMWLNTTNDNIRAIRFYQRRGMRLAAARPGAVDLERVTIKPEIPLVGNDGIRIRDELEFELEL
jgi:GNAT superfamily N-acetyltransferase